MNKLSESTRPVDLISTIRERLSELSKSDKRIAEYLLAEPENFVSANVKTVAVATGVSEATVVRFGRNFGCDGFKNLKILLAQHLAVGQALKDSEDGAPSLSVGTYVDRLYYAINDRLKDACRHLTLEDLDNAARVIAESERVFIYGVGGSSAVMATELHNRLFRLNVTCIAFVDNYQQRMSAATLTPNDSVILVSSTGRPRSLLDSADLCSHYGAKSIAITDRESRLGRAADICLSVYLSQAGVAHDQPNPMRFAQLFAIDCLAHRVAVVLGDSAQESLKRVRASLASIHGIVSQQPIGD